MVMINGIQCDWFQMSVGSRQGDPLSPGDSFCSSRDNGPSQIDANSGVKVQGIRINSLKFAYDLYEMLVELHK